MPTRRIQQGDCLISIAARFGIWDPNRIWEHADNTELRKKRKHPSVLQEGDEVFIPEPVTKTISLAVDQSHTIVVKMASAGVRIRLLDVDESAMANLAYELRIGPRRLTGTSDGDGWVEQKIPATATSCELIVSLGEAPPGEGPSCTWKISLGHLDPVDTARGLEQRLANLGYWPLDQVPHELVLPFALRAFQQDHGLEMTGEPNAETQDRLREEHGGI